MLTKEGLFGCVPPWRVYLQVQRLLSERLDPSWLFSQLFLIKDCYAQQLETAGMWADALQVRISSRR